MVYYHAFGAAGQHVRDASRRANRSAATTTARGTVAGAADAATAADAADTASAAGAAGSADAAAISYRPAFALQHIIFRRWIKGARATPTDY